jgi:hypothetical protein
MFLRLSKVLGQDAIDTAKHKAANDMEIENMIVNFNGR